MQKYIGFDVSSNKIGVAELTIDLSNKETWKLFEVIELGANNSDQSVVEKMKEIIRWFRDNKSYDYDLIVFEQSNFGSANLPVFVGAFIQACVNVWGETNIIRVEPRQWQKHFKKWLKMDSETKWTKDMSIDTACKVAKANIKSDDVADAVLMTYAASKGLLTGKVNKMTRTKKKAIDAKITTARSKLELEEQKHKDLKAKQGVRQWKDVVYKTKKDKEIPERIKMFKQKIKDLKESKRC